jgi:hypothetical protein
VSTKIAISGGAAVMVYDDRWLPIVRALGAPAIERATDVEWDSARGEWVATHRATGTEIARGTCRAHVIQAEVAWLEARLGAAPKGDQP